MKKLITMILSIILATATLAACEPAYEADIDNGTGRGQIGAIEDYRMTTGWSEGPYITTPEGHRWRVENPDEYTGYVDIAYDGMGTDTLDDDKIIYIIERG